MPRPILIGKQRRITIAELAALCFQNIGQADVVLQIANEEDNDGAEEREASLLIALREAMLSEKFTSLSMKDDSTSSIKNLDSKTVFVGTLALLAMAISQERALSSPTEAQQTSAKLVDLENAILKDSGAFADDATLAKLLGTPSSLMDLLSSIGIISSSSSFIQNTVVPKAIDNARIVLSLAKLHELTITAHADLCVASLSAERLSVDAKQTFDSTWYDTLRPHRSCIATAQIMRVLVEGSKYAVPAKKGDEQPKPNSSSEAVAAIPTTHGPSHDAIISAYKTLELELNSCDDPRSPNASPEIGGIMGIAVSNLLNVTVQLMDLSLRRAGNSAAGNSNAIQLKSPSSMTELAQTFESIVLELIATLEKEMALGLAFAVAELIKAKDDFEKKEADKAERAAAYTAKQGGGNDGKDEFEGMSEEKKQKILRKRAEKEAKAAAKKKKTAGASVGGDDGASGISSIASQLFGLGTSQLLKLLLPTGDLNVEALTPELNITILTKMEEIIDKLLRGGVQRTPKIAKGTRDYLPEEMTIRDQAFQIIRRAFKRHGAVEIDTPVFELKETLTGKYGEDSKLIYDLADQGGELLSLRYDLTVPFARYLSLNTVGNIKRFHIGKVYRRDQPQLSRGRYREFYQCDFDIAGQYGRMVPDAECLCVAIEILASLPIGDFMIKINHRCLLDAILDICGVPAEKFRTICSAVDKLDKEEWEEVKKEMIDKGLEGPVADKIGTFVLQKGAPREMYKTLMDSGKFGSHKGASQALEDMRILFEYLDAMGKLDSVSFDMSLARGLDYYTGVIYEAVSVSGDTQVGSIGGGGRYDNLVGMFQGAGKQVPCVGVSIGIERVFTLMEARIRAKQGGSLKQGSVSVLVASIGENMMAERMKLAKLLWDGNISAEYSQQENPKLAKEITNALEREVPFMAIVGEEELKEGKCKIKDLKARDEVLVAVEDVVATLIERGAIPVGCEFAAEMKKN